MDPISGSGPPGGTDASLPLRDVEAFLEQAQEGVFLTDPDGRIAMINARAEGLFGYARHELIGQPVKLLLPAGLPRPELDGTGSRRWRDVELNLLGRHRSGGNLAVHASVTYPSEPGRFAATVFIRQAAPTEGAGGLPPVTSASAEPAAPSRPAAEVSPVLPEGVLQPEPEETWARADIDGGTGDASPLYDPLTGLPGRLLFMDRLSVALAGSSRRSTQVAVFLIDIDRFRLINDSYGKEMGDRLLVAMAETLFGVLRPGDTLARVGEDEFAILCEDIAKREGAATIAERVHGAVSAPFDLDGERVNVSATLGFSVGSGQLHAPESVFRKAEEALVRAKDRGPGTREDADATAALSTPAPPARAASAGAPPPPEIAQPGTAGAERPLEVAAAVHPSAQGGDGSHGAPRPPEPVPAPAAVTADRSLAGAFQRGEFRLVYQPIIRLHSGRIAGVEALLRWQDPERGLLAPGEFMAEAEETGMIHHIGAWVLEEACREAERLQAAQPEGAPLMLSVNLSARQLADPEFVGVVRRILAGSRVDPGTVYLEVGESSLMDDAEAAVAMLSALRSTGVRMSVDDFGTGFSSLSHLNRFPIDFLKIDRSVVEGLDRDAAAANLVTAVISMAHALGLPTIAEGVETDLQVYTLRRLSCDYAQGYRFARPQPLDEVLRLLAADPVW
jgi:diguanylate cyclase (GGDEF)-like protein/PAS domain S-box-containing protein